MGRAHDTARGDRCSGTQGCEVREMRNAETVLGVIYERGRHGLPTLVVCRTCHEAIHYEKPKRHKSVA